MTERDQKSFPRRKRLSCSDVEELVDSFIDGEMSTELNTAFRAHLEQCSECSGLVHDCEAIVSAARTLADMPLPDDVGERLRLALRDQVGHTCPSRPKLWVVKS